MTDAGKARGLDKVYAATNAEELATAYAAWAAEYDRDTIGLGYCLPFVITGWVGRYAKPGAALLDVGCGTGLSGPILKAMGYDNLTGLDMSAQMLDIARTRDAYSELVEGRLGERLPSKTAASTFASLRASSPAARARKRPRRDRPHHKQGRACGRDDSRSADGGAVSTRH